MEMTTMKIRIASCFLGLIFSQTVLAAEYGFIDDNWKKFESRNFQLITDLSDDKAEAVIADLENFRYYLPRLTEVRFEEYNLPIRIFAFASTSDFQEYIDDGNLAGIFYPTEYGGFSAMNLAGYRLDGKPNFYRQILLHEFSHYIATIKVDSFNPPLWYSEGLAEYYSTMLVTDKLLKFGGIAKERVMGYNMGKFNDSRPPLEAVLKRANNFHSENGFINYSTANIFVQYSMSDKERKKSLEKFVAALKTNPDTDAAWDSAYNISYSEMAAELKHYIKKNKFKYKIINLKKPYNFGEILQRELTSDELAESFAEMEIATAGNGFDQRTLALLDNKNSPKAKLLRAEIALSQGDTNQAQNILSDATEFKAIESELHGTQGRLYLSEAFSSKDKVSLLKKARGHFRKSLHIDPFNMKSYLGITDVYLYWLDQDPSIDIKEALSSIEQAIYFQKSYGNYQRLAGLYQAKGEDEDHQKIIAKMTSTGFSRIPSKADEASRKCIETSEAKHWVEAKKYCEQAYSIEQTVYTINNLAWLYVIANATEIADAEKALQLAQRAVKESSSGAPNILDTLAAAYAVNGQFKDAISTQKQAIAMVEGKTKQQFKSVLKAYKEGKTYY